MKPCLSGRSQAARLIQSLGLCLVLASVTAFAATGKEAAPAGDALKATEKQLASRCAAPTRQYLKEAAQLGELATQEHRLFQGHEINAEGRIWRFGITETDNTPLDAEARAKYRVPEQYAWQRIVTYWETGVGLSDAPVFALQNAFVAMNYPKAVEAAKVNGLSAQWLNKVPRLAEQAAVANTPWSAAFISYLIRQVRLGPEFNYSKLHSAFIADALLASLGDAQSAQGFRACDPVSARVQVGDLLCFTREDGAAPVRDFSGLLRAVVKARDQAAPGSRPDLPKFAAHCDVVSAIDARGKTFQVIGGNAWQSVARRTMKMSPASGLDARYVIPVAEAEEQTRHCRGNERCSNLSRKRYVALLKLH